MAGAVRRVDGRAGRYGYREVDDVVLRQEVLGEVILGQQGVVTWLRVGPVAEGIVLPAAARDLRIEETGEVPTLIVKNPGDLTVLLTGNLVVKGGYQTRTVERSVVVGAGGEVRVPVRCVERGRWSPGAGRHDATAFEVDEKLSLRMRTGLTQTRAASAATGQAYTSPQGQVWAQVDDELTRTSTPTGTSSYLAYTGTVRKAQVEEAERRPSLQPPAGANAVLVQPQPGGFWLEVFPTGEALAAQASSVLADLFEAPPDPQHAVRPSRDVLSAVWTAPLRPLDAIAGALGESYAVIGDAARGELVVVGGEIAHMAVCAA